ncbi:MAG: GTPase [Clostridia bacterium]|nr:GTPase [Clostridia bacterium]
MPVYLFTGFLEAGKTKFIRETLCDKRFNDGGKILLLVCEEGEEEYDLAPNPNKKKDEADLSNVTVQTVDDPSWLTPDRLSALQKRTGAERVMVEYNGMWQFDALYNALPQGWFVCQEIMIADASTFLTYNANMRQQTVDKMTSAEVVLFNRVEPDRDVMELHKIVRAISRSANILYERTDGRLENDQIEDPLPFDLNAPVVEIKDEDYAIWYRDLIEDTKKYIGKTVRFKGIIARDDQLPRGVYAIGRHVMTCCVNDIAYRALAVKADDAERYNTRDWQLITAKIVLENCKLYGGKGPVLIPVAREKAVAPEREVATFY